MQQHTLFPLIRNAVKEPINGLLNRVNAPMLILTYHRVAVLEQDIHRIAVSPENFRAHMAFLKRNFPILRFDEEWPVQREPAVVITFDDGYADNVHEALPILEELNVPATFFIATANVGTEREFWWDELEYILLGHRPYPEVFELGDARWETHDLVHRTKLYHEISARIRALTPSRQEQFLDELRNWAQVPKASRSSHRVMNHDEIARLARSSCATVGAHTVHHPVLSSLAPLEQAKEIEESKRSLEMWVGRDIDVFAYPFGSRHDFNGRTMDICRNLGFKRVASTIRDQAHSWSNNYRLPRFMVRDWSIEAFKVRILKSLTSTLPE